MTMVMPALSAAMTFDEACVAVVAFLKASVPMGYWSVSRFDGERQLYLAVADDSYGKQAGDSHPWSDSLCRHMVAGAGPQIAPDAMAVPVYADAGVSKVLPIGAYIGLPIERSDGELFGTICGLDPHRQPDTLAAHAPLLQLLTSLLATILDADLTRTATARALEAVQLEATTDTLTGLYNRRGWDRYLELEEDRYRRFGDPGSVIVLDLDRLKHINDSMGHEAGDDYIRRAAHALRSSLRPSDIVARLGGDEFGVVAANTTPDNVSKLLDRLRLALERAGVMGSFGHAPYTITAGFPGAWAAADKAMYAEKANRRKESPHIPGTPRQRASSG